jgi:hypothetical protein
MKGRASIVAQSDVNAGRRVLHVGLTAQELVGVEFHDLLVIAVPIE